MVINGKWQDGTPMMAVPNYARMNRVPQEQPEVGGDNSVNYAPDATNSAGEEAASAPSPRRRRKMSIESKVWIQA